MKLDNLLYLVHPRLKLAVPVAFYLQGGDGWIVQAGVTSALSDTFLVEEERNGAPPDPSRVEWVVQDSRALMPGLTILGG